MRAARRALVARGLPEVAKFAARRHAEQRRAKVEVDLVAVVGARVGVLAALFAVRPIDEEGQRLRARWAAALADECGELGAGSDEGVVASCHVSFWQLSVSQRPRLRVDLGSARPRLSCPKKNAQL
jgi:hypothetical protein